MPDLRSTYIPGAPLCQAGHFDGPLSWWNHGLPCGGVERQIVAGAQYFQTKGRPVRLLCYNLEPRYGNAFFLPQARTYCSAVQAFSLDQVDLTRLGALRAMVSGILQGCSPELRDTIACLALWFAHLRPRLLQIWNGDNIAALLAAVIAGVPRIVLACRSLSPARRSPYGFEGVNATLAHVLLSHLLRLPGIYLTNNSRAGCRDYEAWLDLPSGTITHTPNVFDLAQWPRPDASRTALLRRRLGLPNHARVLGGLFRFLSIKDPELWVCTALRACAAHPGLYAVVGGGGPERHALKQSIAQSPFADRVLFPGTIKDVSAFLALCDVFLHTAHVEGLPNVVLEAQACQVPVVSTLCGGVADIVVHGQTGFVVDEREEQVLARYVGHILSHPEFAAQAGRRARTHVAQTFAPDIVMPVLEQLYARLLQN